MEGCEKQAQKQTGVTKGELTDNQQAPPLLASP